MRIAVTGSIATDHLMTFPGRFADQLVADQLHTVSLSFLVDNLDVRRGGVGRQHLLRHGPARLRSRSWSAPPAPTSASTAPGWTGTAWTPRSVHISEVLHTARFVCTTDADHNQIASFYTGAMSEARQIELQPVADRVGGLDLVLIGADDPEAMIRHTEECRSRGIPFAADFSQQLARMDGEDIRVLVEGADLPLHQRVREGAHRVQDRLDRRGDPRQGRHPGHHARRPRRPHRAGRRGPDRGRLPGGGAQGRPDRRRRRVPRRLPLRPVLGRRLERAAQVGCMLATLVIETLGTQEYKLRRSHFMDRFTKAYGDEAAAEVQAHLA